MSDKFEIKPLKWKKSMYMWTAVGIEVQGAVEQPLYLIDESQKDYYDLYYYQANAKGRIFLAGNVSVKDCKAEANDHHRQKLRKYLKKVRV